MDMTQLWQMAKESTLEHGEHIPMIYVETKTNEVFIVAVVGDAETTSEKHRFLFGAGRKVGLENKGKEPIFLCFVNEAWISEQRADQPRKYNRASEDPNRREALIAQVMDLTEKPARQMIYRADMIRDGSGELVDLLPSKEPMEAEYTLLPPFLAGWLSASYSDKEIIEMTLKEMARRSKR